MDVPPSKLVGHTLSNMEFSLGTIGYANVDSRWECVGLSFPFNRLYLIRSGGAFAWCGGKEYKLEPGMAYLLPAGLPCIYWCPKQLEQMYFHFNYFCPDLYDLFWGSDRIGCLRIPEGLWEGMKDCLRSEDLLDSLTVQQGILTMITAFMRECGMGRRTAAIHSEAVADTIAYIRENLSARLRIEQLAQRRFVSKTHLTELFRKETGITLGRYIDEQLMLEAQRRLSQTTDTIGAISRDLGFCDQFYFSRRFVQLCGITPQRYRWNAQT